jgi:hypothetical protein
MGVPFSIRGRWLGWLRYGWERSSPDRCTAEPRRTRFFAERGGSILDLCWTLVGEGSGRCWLLCRLCGVDGYPTPQAPRPARRAPPAR